MISQRLAKWLTDYENPRSLGSRLRARRTGRLIALLEKVRDRRGRLSVLDIGGTRRYWNTVPEAVLDRLDARILVVNVPGAPLPASEGRFEFVTGDGCDLAGYESGSFDVVHSNSVIEHVGDWARVKAFAAETRRLAPCLYVQTPNFWFPFEPHFMTPLFHWLPEPTRAWLLMRRGLGHHPRCTTVDEAMTRVHGARLLNRRMLAELFPDCRIESERFLGLAKSLIAIRD